MARNSRTLNFLFIRVLREEISQRELLKLDQAYRLDLLVQERIVVEIKTVESIAAIHKNQLLSYLKLTRCPLGLLINFNVEMLKEGLCRMVNNYSEISESRPPSVK